jgi:hypothetical protein
MTEVWVFDDTRLDEVRALLQARPPLRAVDQPAHWVCPDCQEAVETQFAVCWNCGAQRPA